MFTVKEQIRAEMLQLEKCGFSVDASYFLYALNPPQPAPSISSIQLQVLLILWWHRPMKCAFSIKHGQFLSAFCCVTPVGGSPVAEQMLLQQSQADPEHPRGIYPGTQTKNLPRSLVPCQAGPSFPLQPPSHHPRQRQLDHAYTFDTVPHVAADFLMKSRTLTDNHFLLNKNPSSPQLIVRQQDKKQPDRTA